MTAWRTVSFQLGQRTTKDHPNERVALRHLRELIETRSGQAELAYTYAIFPISDREWEAAQWREMNQRTGVGDVDTLNWPKNKSYDVT